VLEPFFFYWHSLQFIISVRSSFYDPVGVGITKNLPIKLDYQSRYTQVYNRIKTLKNIGVLQTFIFLRILTFVTFKGTKRKE